MKTIEEVKEHFKNAKEVKCACLDGCINEIDDLDFEDFRISIDGSFYFLGKKEIGCYLWYAKNGFAEIISYKEIPVPVRDYVIDTPKHYDNDKGTLYKVASDRNWNPYLFDIVKRLERADKKGEFKSDLEKSINVIKLWLNERE